jgi:DNA topoisomerase IA
MEADLKSICQGQKMKSDIVQSTLNMYKNVLIQVQQQSNKLEQVRNQVIIYHQDS